MTQWRYLQKKVIGISFSIKRHRIAACLDGLPAFGDASRQGKVNVLREFMTPFPSFPQINPVKERRGRRADLGEGECDAFMETLISFKVNALRERWLRRKQSKPQFPGVEVRHICYNYSMDKVRIRIPRAKLAEFCRRWNISELALFGSALRADFHSGSDIDVLVSFVPQAHITLFDMVRMQDELKVIFGREVDLISKRGVENSRNYLRRKAILDSAQVIHVAR